MNPIKYNPVYAVVRFIFLKLSRRIEYHVGNIGKTETLSDSKEYSVFLEIHILDKNKKPKKGRAVFRVIFHSPRISADTVIKRTRFTVPFFSGLPGFCTKQFMVNREDGKFSGRYEWETVEAARRYARSYAMGFMKKRSKPFPVTYEIIDRKMNTVIESGTV